MRRSGPDITVDDKHRRGLIRAPIRWAIIVLTGLLLCIAIAVVDANVDPDSDDAYYPYRTGRPGRRLFDCNDAFRTGGAGGLLLIPAIALLVIKADAIAGIVYLAAGAVILSAALILNHAEGLDWEPFSWMYVAQAAAAFAIGSPAIRAAWTKILRPALAYPRAVSGAVAIAAYLVAAIGMALGNYTYYLDGSLHDRSGDRLGFVILSAVGVGFVVGTLRSRWLAIGSCLVAAMGIFILLSFPINELGSHLWGQSLARTCYLVALVASVIIVMIAAGRPRS